MNKIQKKVMEAVKASPLVYKILNGDEENPKHVRIGSLDIWPENGTCKDGKKTIKRDIKQTIRKIEEASGAKRNGSQLSFGREDSKDIRSEVERAAKEVIYTQIIDSIEKLHKRMDELERLIQSVSVIRRAVKKVFGLFGGGK